MTEEEFDQCPHCGSYGISGLRCHPKFSVSYGGYINGELDMIMIYSHTEAHNNALIEQLKAIGNEIIYKQKWDHSNSKWEEY